MSSIRVEVVRAERERADTVTVELPAGSCVRDALKACGMQGDAVGVFGKRVDPATRLADGDRVELYRPLALDPKERRRRRARKRAKKTRV
jgi:uncharacterized protein